MIEPLGLVIAIIVAMVGYHFASKKQKHRTVDGNTLLKLEESGVDTSQPQSLEFWFYSNHQSAIENLANALQGRDFQVEISDTEDNPRYVIRAMKDMVPDLARLQTLSRELKQLAKEHGAAYDGWGLLSLQCL